MLTPGLFLGLVPTKINYERDCSSCCPGVYIPPRCPCAQTFKVQLQTLELIVAESRDVCNNIKVVMTVIKKRVSTIDESKTIVAKLL